MGQISFPDLAWACDEDHGFILRLRLGPGHFLPQNPIDFQRKSRYLGKTTSALFAGLPSFYAR
jgi:hypothetical protein